MPEGSKILWYIHSRIDRQLEWTCYLWTCAGRGCYDRGILEIMCPAAELEEFSHVITLLINVVTEELRIDVRGFGSTTFRREDLARGFEPNSCFYIQRVEQVMPPNRAFRAEEDKVSEVADGFQANVDQAAYWQASGIKWVQYRESMDTRMRSLTEELLRRALAQAGERVLDIGCGSGATSQRLAEAIGPEGRLLGLDISEPMLTAASERCQRLAQASFLQGDAQVHDFGEETFDLLVSRFGVMFFSDPFAAFRNLHGALKSGARTCFVCWASLADNPWFQIPLEAAKAYLEPPKPTPPRAPGPLAFSDPEYVEEILRAAKFERIRIDRFKTTMKSAESLESQAEFFLHFGPAARLIAAQQPSQETVAAIAKSVADGLTPYTDANGIAVPATVFYVRALKP